MEPASSLHALSLAVHLFPAVGSDQHAIIICSSEQNMPEICGEIVQCSFFAFQVGLPTNEG